MAESSTSGARADPVSAAYDRWAAFYDADANRTRDLDAVVLRQARLPIDGRDVLELGAGTGKNTAWLAEHARCVIALDFSEGMLARARERLSSGPVRFIGHDIRERWPVADESVDVVVGDLVLEHIQVLAPVYAEAWRVIRPGGTVFVCELHPSRQQRGAQAQFADPETGACMRIASHRHTVSDFVNGALDVGFRVRALSEWADTDAGIDELPRLISLTLEKAKP